MTRQAHKTDNLERAAAKAAAARSELEHRVREAHAAGMSLRAIAQAAGVSHETVRRLVAN